MNRRWRAQVSGFKCPVCAGFIDRFRPLDSFYVDNMTRYGWPYPLAECETLNSDGYLCPECGATDRDRLYALYLDRDWSPSAPRPANVVDFAPSKPLQRVLGRLPNVAYRSADLQGEGVDDRVDIADMADIYASETFDLFICSHVLEHVRDDRAALGELFRILKQGGRGIVMVPIVLSNQATDEDPELADPGERWRRFGQFDHVRLYSKGDFIKRIVEAGFQVEQLGADHFGLSSFRRHGITQQSILYVVKKPRSTGRLPKLLS